jgi:hypothetical protein
LPSDDPNDDAFMPAFRRGDPRERRQRQADLRAALLLYGFAARQMISKATGNGVQVPAEVARALTLVERWTAKLLADRPPL